MIWPIICLCFCGDWLLPSNFLAGALRVVPITAATLLGGRLTVIDDLDNYLILPGSYVDLVRECKCPDGEEVCEIFLTGILVVGNPPDRPYSAALVYLSAEQYRILEKNRQAGYTIRTIICPQPMEPKWKWSEL